MKVVMVMFDSLNRHMLPAYGCDWTHAPNFARLAERTVTFDRSYVCSMPCMPARRDFHTGRPNFLHRSWGPLEPFDDSMPEMLKQAGVHTHLATDHYHYFEEGGCTYHTRYKTYEYFRGQEGDPWMAKVAGPDPVNAVGRQAEGGWYDQDLVNREFMRHEEDMCQARTFKAGLDFLDRNHAQDNWFLQIETFDPHEPFFANRKYQDHFAEHYAKWRKQGGPLCDWPPYTKVTESDEIVEHMRYEYASLLAMCDAKLGDVLDTMDRHNMWDDTILIVWTDHGFLLGEHECWAKCWMPFYEEVAHTPFFIWDPRVGKAGERRSALVQPSIDLPVYLLEAFGQQPTEHMTGKSLLPVLRDDAPVRDAAMFGMFGAQLNVTDGRYVYYRNPVGPSNGPLHEHTLMPTHMRHTFALKEFEKVELVEPFNFTKNCKLMRMPTGGGMPGGEAFGDMFTTALYDVHADPQQTRPISDPLVEERMVQHAVKLMQEVDAPPQQYERLGLTQALSKV